MPALIIDQAHWTQLEQVQAQVDRKIRYVTDMERFGVPDWWEPAVDKGDCEDIVLSKRQRLLEMGWPADALRIAVVIDGHGALHAVLTVDVQSPQGKPATYVLDSHFEHVEPWQYLSQYGYTWLERSKPGSTQWARLDNGGSVTVQQIATLATAIMPASPRWSDIQQAQVTVTASVKLLGEELTVAAAHAAPAVLDAGQDRNLLIQAASSSGDEAPQVTASADDDVTVAPASARASRHSPHHGGHARSHGHHGRRHVA